MARSGLDECDFFKVIGDVEYTKPSVISNVIIPTVFSLIGRARLGHARGPPDR